jgi:hypothetical protein
MHDSVREDDDEPSLISVESVVTFEETKKPPVL